MKKQVVVIHGGDSFANYEEFFASLAQKILNLDSIRFRDWKSKLPEALGDDFDVLQPRMPNPQNAKYAEWKLWFEKLAPQLEDGVILLGHSLGGVFLAKYFSEERFPKQTDALLLVGAPFDTDSGRTLVEFAIANDLSLLAEQVGRVLLYHSYDDPVVSFDEFTKYAARLPHAALRTFTDKGHFNQMEFNELVDDLRSL